MKRTLLMFSILFSLSSVTKESERYQVVTVHPHDFAEVERWTHTIHKDGRLWVVELREDFPARVRKHLRPLKGNEKTFFPSKNHEKTFISDSEDSSGMVEKRVKKVLAGLEQERIKKDVEWLASFRTRAAGTEDNRLVTNLIEKRLTSLGYEGRQLCYREGACSVVAEKPGASSEVILVLAHFDSVGQSFAGADDNASGTAVLLEMARVLSSYTNGKTLRFFATNGEELGLLGAKHYVNELVKSGEIKNIVLAINMDMVGYNENGIIELETDPREEALSRWYADLTTHYTQLRPKITLGAWGSDHVPFLQAGVPAMLTIEDWNTKTPCYHQACDLPSTLNYGYAFEVAKLNVSAVVTKDLN